MRGGDGSSGLMCKVPRPPCCLLRALQLASPSPIPWSTCKYVLACLPMRLCRDTARHDTTRHDTARHAVQA